VASDSPAEKKELKKNPRTAINRGFSATRWKRILSCFSLSTSFGIGGIAVNLTIRTQVMHLHSCVLVTGRNCAPAGGEL
jgi:hypothetical protein